MTLGWLLSFLRIKLFNHALSGATFDLPLRDLHLSLFSCSKLEYSVLFVAAGCEFFDLTAQPCNLRFQRAKAFFYARQLEYKFENEKARLVLLKINLVPTLRIL